MIKVLTPNIAIIPATNQNPRDFENSQFSSEAN